VYYRVSARPQAKLDTSLIFFWRFNKAEMGCWLSGGFTVLPQCGGQATAPQQHKTIPQHRHNRSMDCTGAGEKRRLE
jgi:hypothetical protein